MVEVNGFGQYDILYDAQRIDDYGEKEKPGKVGQWWFIKKNGERRRGDVEEQIDDDGQSDIKIENGGIVSRSVLLAPNEC